MNEVVRTVRRALAENPLLMRVGRTVVPVQYQAASGPIDTFPHAEGCQDFERLCTYTDATYAVCSCRGPMVLRRGETVFTDGSVAAMSLDAFVTMIQHEIPRAAVRMGPQRDCDGIVPVVVRVPMPGGQEAQVAMRFTERLLQTREGRMGCCDMLRAKFRRMAQATVVSSTWDLSASQLADVRRINRFPLENAMLPSDYSRPGGDRSLGIQEFVGVEHYGMPPLLTGRVARDSGFNFFESADVPEADGGPERENATLTLHQLAVGEGRCSTRFSPRPEVDYARNLDELDRWGRQRYYAVEMANGSRIFTSGDGTEAPIEGYGAAPPPEEEREQRDEAQALEEALERTRRINASLDDTLRQEVADIFMPGGLSAHREVDYARDLADAPTFAEALAALDAHKARRRVG